MKSFSRIVESFAITLIGAFVLSPAQSCNFSRDKNVEHFTNYDYEWMQRTRTVTEFEIDFSTLTFTLYLFFSSFFIATRSIELSLDPLDIFISLRSIFRFFPFLYGCHSLFLYIGWKARITKSFPTMVEHALISLIRSILSLVLHFLYLLRFPFVSTHRFSTCTVYILYLHLLQHRYVYSYIFVNMLLVTLVWPKSTRNIALPNNRSHYSQSFFSTLMEISQQLFFKFFSTT